MNDSPTQLFINKLEARYGTADRPKYKDEDRNEIAAFLLRRYADHLDTLGIVMAAIRENCQIFYGLPELAKIVEAINKYQKDYGEKIQFKDARFEGPGKDEIVKHKQESIRDLRSEAIAAGIDTSEEGWIAALAMKIVEKERGAK